MKKMLSLFLLVLIAFSAITASAASNVFIAGSITREEDDIIVYAVTKYPCSSIQVNGVQLEKMIDGSWEGIGDISFPEISAIGHTFSANTSFDQDILEGNGAYRICVTINADGNMEKFYSETYQR